MNKNFLAKYDNLTGVLQDGHLNTYNVAACVNITHTDGSAISISDIATQNYILDFSSKLPRDEYLAFIFQYDEYNIEFYFVYKKILAVDDLNTIFYSVVSNLKSIGNIYGDLDNNKLNKLYLIDSDYVFQEISAIFSFKGEISGYNSSLFYLSASIASNILCLNVGLSFVEVISQLLPLTVDLTYNCFSSTSTTVIYPEYEGDDIICNYGNKLISATLNGECVTDLSILCKKYGIPEQLPFSIKSNTLSFKVANINGESKVFNSFVVADSLNKMLKNYETVADIIKTSELPFEISAFNYITKKIQQVIQQAQSDNLPIKGVNLITENNILISLKL